MMKKKKIKSMQLGHGLALQAVKAIYKPVQMGNGDDFTSNIVIETIHSIGVDKTVSYPNTSLHAIFNFTTNL